jgi:hypothetical protein
MPQTIIAKRAIALGYRQGYAKGVRQGLRRGEQRGIKEGRRKGVIDGMRRLILRQVTQRFGPAPASLQRRIESLADARALERIASALLQPTGLEQLKKLAARGKPAPKGRRKTFRALPEGPAGGLSRRRPRRLAPLRYPD